MTDAAPGSSAAEDGARIDTLERRLARLEQLVEDLSPAGSRLPASAGEPIDRPADDVVGYQGAVDLAGPVSWEIRYHAPAILNLPTDALADVFAALGHPVRITIVRRLLAANASVTELQETGEFGTSGQLYHHLKILTTASVVTKVGRNEYAIAPTHVVPTLVALLAAGDITGSL